MCATRGPCRSLYPWQCRCFHISTARAGKSRWLHAPATRLCSRYQYVTRTLVPPEARCLVHSQHCGSKGARTAAHSCAEPLATRPRSSFIPGASFPASAAPAAAMAHIATGRPHAAERNAGTGGRRGGSRASDCAALLRATLQSAGNHGAVTAWTASMLSPVTCITWPRSTEGRSSLYE